MSEPQHPAPFGGHTGNQPGGQPDGQAMSGGAASSGVQAGSLESIAAVGARLMQLREAKGWSIDDVSARLKVSPQKLRLLEAGDLSHLPDRTFAAGIVRSYAKMLGADPAPFTAALRRASGPVEQNLTLPASSGSGLPRGRVSVPLGGSGRRRSWLWGVAAVIVAVIALAMWHTGGDSAAWLARLKASANGTAVSSAGGTSAASSVATPDEAAAANTGEASSPGETATAAAGEGAQPMPHPLGTNALPASSSAIAAVQGASAIAPAASAPAAVAAAQTPAPAPASAPAVAGTGGNALEMRVKQDSWFSVRQKDGKEVFSGLVRAGDAQRVEGELPFKVTIGNRAGLESLTLDDEPVDPAKYAVARGNVARFSLP
ncbi:FIG021952: putative membrane protein [Caballeronia glathei]|uniref:XRE family transcriptional regulator n=1 Tax=Caballeronia glathei TaxID=60547 RepID=A0A069PSQ8_9BURK|nr:helix-turn-helix domain-containing protein [Caballeronia glathei]KDR43778.1 XRE family transcriptional regulator [Caballeronia glathei]CDY75575.1 FIG021952: putative membrane protein [Caballeronia glathei]